MVRIFPFDPSMALALPALVTIYQGNAQVIRFTTGKETVIVEDGSAGLVYAPWPGADITGLQYPSDGTPVNADIVVMAIPGSAIKPGDGLKGMLDNWPITIELFDPGNLGAGTYVAISGTIGSVDEDAFGKLTIAANGQLRLAAEKAMAEKYSVTGREALGDDRCKVPICLNRDIAFYDIGRNQDYVPRLFNDGTTGLIQVADCYGRARSGHAGDVTDYANVYYEALNEGTTGATAPTFPGTPGAEVIDGSVVFVARDGWSRYAFGTAIDPFHIQFTTLPDPRASDPTWYSFGGLFVRSGALSGFPSSVINEWDPSTKIVTLFLPIDPNLIPVGTQFEIYPGCDLTYPTCFSKFNNILNLRAEYMVPPPEAIVAL